jgi:hypothetical protein
MRRRCICCGRFVGVNHIYMMETGYAYCNWDCVAGHRERIKKTIPVCHQCGSNTQVWVNQITNKLTCHRLGCQVEVSNGKDNC